MSDASSPDNVLTSPPGRLIIDTEQSPVKSELSPIRCEENGKLKASEYNSCDWNSDINTVENIGSFESMDPKEQIALNQAMFVEGEGSESGDKSTAHSEVLTVDKNINENGLWYKMPREACEHVNTDGRQQEHMFLMDSILSMEQDFAPRHSTPVRDVHNPSIVNNRLASAFIDTNVEVQSIAKSLQDYGPRMPEPVNPVASYQKKETRPEKPPYSYAAMCVMAIHYSKDRQLTFSELRKALANMFPFFRGQYTGWRSTVRHAISNSKFFNKINNPDGTNAWCVDYSEVTMEMFARQRKGENSVHYKPYLHQELGLPPVTKENSCQPNPNGLSLPPKPCYSTTSALTLPVTPDDDFLCARKDSVATPAPSICSNISENDNDGDIQQPKRRKTEHPTTSSPMITSQKQMVMVEPTPKSATSSSGLPPAGTLLKSTRSQYNNYQYPYGANLYHSNGNYGYHDNIYSQNRDTYSRDVCKYMGSFNSMPVQFWPSVNHSSVQRQMWLPHDPYGYYGNPVADAHYWSQFHGQTQFYNTMHQGPLNLSKQDSKNCDTL